MKLNSAVSVDYKKESKAVVVSFAGDGILWDELGQIFKIEDLQNHIYGRKAWMKSIAATISS